MQTPLLEAFTNNFTSLMKHKLISLPKTNLLFLPEMKLNTAFEAGTNTVVFSPAGGLPPLAGTFIVRKTRQLKTLFIQELLTAWAFLRARTQQQERELESTEGLNTTEIPPKMNLDPDLVETSYIVQVDNRFAKIDEIGNKSQPRSVSYIDDDNIASYYIMFGSDINYVHSNSDEEESAAGYRWTPKLLEVKIREMSLEINTSTHLFTALGGSSI